MGSKKKTTKSGGKSTKGAANIVDGVSISEMSREQLEPFILRIQHELEREREERHFFQLERDKVKTFWEIARQQLYEYRSNLRNKDKQLEKLEARHEMQLKLYRQKIKYLSHGQHAQLSELKVENMLSLRDVEQDLAARELLLLDQNRTLKLQITNHLGRHKNELRTLFLEKNAQMSKMRFDGESRRRAFEHKYQRDLQLNRDEMQLKNNIAVAEIEQRKNVLIRRLTDAHHDLCKRADNFFGDIVAQNLALIFALKNHMRALHQENMQMKNEIRAVKKQNSQLVMPLKIANRKIVDFQNELNMRRRNTHHHRVTKKQTKILRRENERLRIQYEHATSLYEQTVREKDEKIGKLAQAHLDMDKRAAYRELIVQRAAAAAAASKLEASSQSVLDELTELSPTTTPIRDRLSCPAHVSITTTAGAGAPAADYDEVEDGGLGSMMDELSRLFEANADVD